MYKVDIEKCIGCGLCIKDCFVKDIELIDNKANIKNERCMKCGHCVAICPKGVVSTDTYNMDDVKEYSEIDFDIKPDTLLNFIKFRRSTRNFKEKDVEDEKILKIIEAGRFTQTSTNSQDVSYIVVKENIDKLKEMVFVTLNNLGENIIKNLNEETIVFKRYAEMWINMYDAFKKNPKNDSIFFNAPSVILVVSNNPINGELASSNMEIVTNALGLGTFFSGFFVKASEENPEIRNFIGLKENQKVVSCMVIGYPNVTYKRTAPRKDAEISWK